jgi:hypothetical protein
LLPEQALFLLLTFRSRPRLNSLRKRCFAAAIFGFVGAPDFSPAIEVGLIPGFSPGALFQGARIFMRELANCAGAKARFFFAAISPA